MKKSTDFKTCIDLTRMECKAGTKEENFKKGASIDLTRMECKVTKQSLQASLRIV